ncbi:MAG: hypothetical protein HQL37_02660 [Alphaproteobacteria bacterium]|nr:hypothetical protein [Alphaproteobacteria bacterium]
MVTRSKECFDSAAKRHWGNAEVMDKATRIAAADHHFGIAAECAIKYAIAQTNPGSVPKKHLNVLWGSATQLLDPGAFSELCATLKGDNPFDMQIWLIDDRYAETGALEADIKTVDNGQTTSRYDRRRQATLGILLHAGLLP